MRYRAARVALDDARARAAARERALPHLAQAVDDGRSAIPTCRATLAAAGWDTVPAHAARRYPEVAESGPEWRDAARILLSTEPYAFRSRDAAAIAKAHARPAALIDGEWTSWYGVRAIEGLRALAAMRTASARPD